MTKTSAIVMLVVLGLQLSAAEGAVPEAIDRLRYDLETAAAEGDADAVVAVFAPDGILMPPGRGPIAGSESLRAHFESVYREFATISNSKQVWGIHDGTLAVEWIAYNNEVLSKSGGLPRFTSGNAVHVYALQDDGSWKLVLDIFNSDQPATTEPLPHATTADYGELRFASPPSRDQNLELARNAEFEAMNTANLESLVRAFSNDAVLLPPNSRPVSGSGEIQARFRRIFAENDISVNREARRLYLGEALAVEYFGYSNWVVANGQASGESSEGQGVHVFVRDDDGGWRIRLDIFH